MLYSPSHLHMLLNYFVHLIFVASLCLTKPGRVLVTYMCWLCNGFKMFCKDCKFYMCYLQIPFVSFEWLINSFLIKKSHILRILRKVLYMKIGYVLYISAKPFSRQMTVSPIFQPSVWACSCFFANQKSLFKG